MTNAEVLDLCATLGVAAKGPSASLAEAYADMVKRRAERDGLTRPEQPEEPKVEKKVAAKKAPAKKAAAKAAPAVTDEAASRRADRRHADRRPPAPAAAQPAAVPLRRGRRSGTATTETGCVRCRAGRRGSRRSDRRDRRGRRSCRADTRCSARGRPAGRSGTGGRAVEAPAPVPVVERRRRSPRRPLRPSPNPGSSRRPHLPQPQRSATTTLRHA